MADTGESGTSKTTEIDQPLLNSSGLVSILTRAAKSCTYTEQVDVADLRPGDQLAFPRI